MTYLYHPDGIDDRMMEVFFKFGMQNFLCINGTIPDEDIPRYALDYLTAIHNLDLIYHSLHCVLQKYSAWIAGERDLYRAALLSTSPRLNEALMLELQDIHGDHYPDAYAEYAFAVKHPLQPVQPSRCVYRTSDS